MKPASSRDICADLRTPHFIAWTEVWHAGKNGGGEKCATRCQEPNSRDLTKQDATQNINLDTLLVRALANVESLGALRFFRLMFGCDLAPTILTPTAGTKDRAAYRIPLCGRKSPHRSRLPENMTRIQYWRSFTCNLSYANSLVGKKTPTHARALSTRAIPANHQFGAPWRYGSRSS